MDYDFGLNKLAKDEGVKHRISAHDATLLGKALGRRFSYGKSKRASQQYPADNFPAFINSF
jgi:hypothetical protein